LAFEIISLVLLLYFWVYPGSSLGTYLEQTLTIHKVLSSKCYDSVSNSQVSSLQHSFQLLFFNESQRLI